MNPSVQEEKKSPIGAPKLSQKCAAFLQIAALVAALSGCSAPPKPVPLDDPKNDAAAVDALKKWWKEANYADRPVKAGTVVPAETITTKTGRVIKIPMHMQTKEDAEEQLANLQFVTRNLATVRGFSVHAETVTVETNLSDDVDGDYKAREICRDLGGFVWAGENRRYGLQDIKVVGAKGELLSSRIGIGGAVQ